MPELLELVVTGIADKILSEFNPNHDDRGRFSSGGGGGGSMKAVPKNKAGAHDVYKDSYTKQYRVKMNDGNSMNRQELCDGMNKLGRKSSSGKAIYEYQPSGKKFDIRISRAGSPSEGRIKNMSEVAKSLDGIYSKQSVSRPSTRSVADVMAKMTTTQANRYLRGVAAVERSRGR